MKDETASIPGARSGFPSWPTWPTVLIGIVVIKAVLSFAVKPGSFLFSYSGISYFVLLVLATSFAVCNAIRNTLKSWPFWVFMAMAFGLWALDQLITMYYDFGLRVNVPDDSIADPVLFLHIVPLMAAALVLPSRKTSDRRLYRLILDFLLLLVFWGFLYAYWVFPYQYLRPNEARYALRFDVLYLIENWVLVLILGILGLRVEAPWKKIYLHLLGACTLYALSSAFANLAIDSGGYVNGKLYGLGLIASVCWFVWVPLGARQPAASDPGKARWEGGKGSQASAWAMFLVVMISIPIVWELLHRNEAAGLRTFRLLAAIAAIVCLSSAAYLKEYIAKSKLAFDLGLANDRFRLALVAGKSVGWEYNIKTGRNYWFGDLDLFGVGSDKRFGRNEDLYRYVHPEDRPVLAKALEESRENRQPYTAEFRVLRADGTVRWFAATGQFYFRPNGAAERMLGMAADITERKQAEEALANVSLKVIGAEERERKRISVDLHENIGQRLTMLTIEISQLKEQSSNPKVDVRERLGAMWEQTLGILEDVKASAHELHSPRLEYLGLGAIVKAFCQEFSQRKRVEIEFKTNGVPDTVQPEVSICFFRVLQEALYNGLNHSGVRQFAVQIWGTERHLHLTVSDPGAGFDVAAARNGHGLGLIRMEERVKLLKGTLVIESQVGHGTKVYACVPLDAGSEAGSRRSPVNSATVPQ